MILDCDSCDLCPIGMLARIVVARTVDRSIATATSPMMEVRDRAIVMPSAILQRGEREG